MGLSDDRAYLKALIAQRLAIVSGGVSSYSVPGRSVSKLSLADLNAEIARTESRIAAHNGGLITYANLRADSSEDIH